MVVSAAVSWIVCDLMLPMKMIEGREAWKCVGCLGGRLVVCTGVSAGVFWMIWHRSKRYDKAVRWIKALIGWRKA